MAGSTLALTEMRLQGQGPFLFALDTGASSSVVDVDVADRIGLARTGSTRTVTGVVGQGDVALARRPRHRAELTVSLRSARGRSLPGPPGMPGSRQEGVPR
ncbi:aspartyl protease family protein [Pseudonocardia sp. RS010]|uniref:aspartyl protease family protein n=1 Tax=Pseudonocardia sp. RS010 TaxID=3385979 RepID=UPI0039A3DC99